MAEVLRTYETRSTSKANKRKRDTNKQFNRKHLQPFHLAVIQKHSIVILDEEFNPIRRLKVPHLRVAKIITLSGGQLVAWEHGTSQLYMWDTIDSDYYILDNGPKHHGYGLRIPLSNNRLACSFRGNIRIWNVETKTYVDLKGHKEHVETIIELSDGRFVSGDMTGSIWIWNNMHGELLYENPQRNPQRNCTSISLLYLRNGHLLSAMRHYITVHNLETRSSYQLIDETEGELVQLPDGRIAYGNGYNFCVLYLDYSIREKWDWRSIETQETFIPSPRNIVVLMDGRLAIVTWKKDIHIWNPNNGYSIKINNENMDIYSIDNNGMILSSWDHDVQYFDLETQTVVREFKGHSACLFYTDKDRAQFRKNMADCLDSWIVRDIQGLICEYVKR